MKKIILVPCETGYTQLNVYYLKDGVYYYEISYDVYQALKKTQRFSGGCV